jgi:hypothetical protein
MQSHINVVDKLLVEMSNEKDPQRQDELRKEMERVRMAGVQISDAYNARMNAGRLGQGLEPATVPAPSLPHATALAPKRVPIVFKVPGRLAAPSVTASAGGTEKNAGGAGTPKRSDIFNKSNKVIIHFPPKEVGRNRPPPPPDTYDMMYDYDEEKWMD